MDKKNKWNNVEEILDIFFSDLEREVDEVELESDEQDENTENSSSDKVSCTADNEHEDNNIFSEVENNIINNLAAENYHLFAFHNRRIMVM